MIFFKLGGKRFSDNLFNLLVHLNSWLARLWMALFFRWVGLTQRGPLLVSPRLKYFHWLDWEIFSWQIIITFAASPQTRPCDNYSWRGLRSGWDSSGWKWMEIIDMYNYMYNICIYVVTCIMMKVISDWPGQLVKSPWSDAAYHVAVQGQTLQIVQTPEEYIIQYWIILWMLLYDLFSYLKRALFTLEILFSERSLK